MGQDLVEHRLAAHNPEQTSRSNNADIYAVARREWEDITEVDDSVTM